MANILADRIRDRLAELDKSARAASIEAGLSADAIRKILDGSSKSPRHENMEAIARALQTTVPYLTGRSEQDKLELDTYNRLTVRHEVAAGRWLATDEWADEPKEPDIPVIPATEFKGAQWLERVVGPSMDLLIPDGALVHVVDAHDIAYTPQQDDIVVIERIRAQGAFRERSLKQIDLTTGEPVLLGRSHVARYNGPLSFSEGLPPDADDVVVEIAGLVLRAYIHFRPPSPSLNHGRRTTSTAPRGFG